MEKKYYDVIIGLAEVIKDLRNDIYWKDYKIEEQEKEIKKLKEEQQK